MQLRERLKSMFGLQADQQHIGPDPDEILRAGFQRLKSADPETNRQWIRLQNALSQQEAGLRVITPRPIRRFAPALTVVAFAAIGFFFYLTVLAPSTDLFKTGIGEKMEIILNDGSRVSLNYATHVVVPELRQGEPRTVSLEGEAFFSVRRNEVPFIISTRHARVAVVGTEFNVRAREGSVEVAVVSGVVNVSASRDGVESTLRLEKGQRAICLEHKPPVRIGDIPSAEYPGWLHGKLFLEKTSFASACLEIEMRFDVSIRIPDIALRSELITGVLDARSAESSVAALCELAGKKYIYDGKEFTLY